MEIRAKVSASVRGGGGAPPPVQKRLRPHLSEDMEIRAKVSASVRGGGGAPPPVQKRRAMRLASHLHNGGCHLWKRGPMKQTWIATTIALTLGCALTLSAQAAAGTQTQPAAQPPAGDAHRTVTIVGCVQRGGGTGAATGTTGVAGASATVGSSGWILANASTDGAAPTNAAPAATPRSSDNTTAPDRRSGSTYILEPGSKPGSQDLSAHAGHKVEITGTLAGPPNPGAATAGTSTDITRGTTATAQPSANATASTPAAQRLQVASVKMISQTCS